MVASRFYSSTAGKMALVGAVAGAAATLTVDTVVGLPGSMPYTLMLDPGSAAEEVVEVTAAGGTTLTVTRGVDGTSAQAHLNGAEVRHAYSARDFQDSRNHEANTTTAHGVTGGVVGTTNVQALTNKTLVAPALTAPVVTGGLTGDTATFTGNVTAPNIGVSGNVAVYAQKVVNTVIYAGAPVVTLLTAPTITADGVKVWKITANIFWFAGDTATELWEIKIRDSVAGVVQIARKMTGASPNFDADGFSMSVALVPAAGAHTYTLETGRWSGTGGANVQGQATAPLQIIVEQIT